MAAACPDGRCDGSGFLYDEVKRTARALLVPARSGSRASGRRRSQGRLPKRFREVSFDREPVPSIARRAPDVVREVQRYARTISERLAEGRGLWFTGSVGTGKTTLAMLVSKAAMEADHTVAIYSLPRLLSMLRELLRRRRRVLAQRADRAAVRRSTCCTSTTSAPSRRARGCSSSSTRSSTRATRTGAR